ncbi:unnamed protein product [Miscanthus lutarioriparius]|uniref:Uncharacterized protein n=1 Tax=Miscanthus lutarioriparius TaxID=422564 RepID=A0A811MJ22_9POAL|nr:unnamed protein product [Miscanthus lutarioriparius]
MASRCSSLSLPWLPFLVVVLIGDAAAAMAMPRPLLGIAETPTAAPGTAAGPAGASWPGGGGRPDRSVAGAEVILAGFAAAVMVIIFCYIRVTRKNSGSGSNDVGVGLGSGGKQQQGL